MSLIRKCPYCGSPWVCWNAFYAWGGDRQRYEKANPHIEPKNLKDWGHECFDCEAVNETYHKVCNGLPFWFVKRVYPLTRKYQFINWWPEWHGFGKHKATYGLGLIYEWYLWLGFWEIRRWHDLKDRDIERYNRETK